VLGVVGPTASGKTNVAISIAEKIGAEIISVDSMQVYRGMDIGTAKPSLKERRGVAHHMIDIADPENEFSVAEFRRVARRVMGSAEVPLIITGGSGLHFRSLVDLMSFPPTDPELRLELEQAELPRLVVELIEADRDAGSHVDLSNHRRVVRSVEIWRLTGETPTDRANSSQAQSFRDYIPEIPFTAVGIDPGDVLESRIAARLMGMRAAGLVMEIRHLAPRLGRVPRRAVGYREILDHLDGVVTEDEAFSAIERNTRRLAKRQRTWFRRDPRIRWIPWSEDEENRVATAMEILQ
jgi:tRNA dimethylallyltransferase